jgi:hypothetical protein
VPMGLILTPDLVWKWRTTYLLCLEYELRDVSLIHLQPRLTVPTNRQSDRRFCNPDFLSPAASCLVIVRTRSPRYLYILLRSVSRVSVCTIQLPKHLDDRLVRTESSLLSVSHCKATARSCCRGCRKIVQMMKSSFT